MKALKVLAFMLIATFCYSAVNAQDMHKMKKRRHHHHQIAKRRHWKKRPQ